MGACISKAKNEEPPARNATSRRRFTSTEEKLGDGKVKGDVKERQQTHTPSSKQNSELNGRKLGRDEQNKGDLNDNNNSNNVRSTAAKAAELRYQKQQRLKQESKDKLKAMSKMSKDEKGL
ncbi:uncharacterized protein PRCAT00002794001 [Priceomyces carsonii]|uniref:uncharacterized protein n=1 Tax=Priceomyces carsonii TaxID=28549 RepID=UPI002ED93414|nr:unnamed protein product [Priceomyces carsonii]